MSEPKLISPMLDHFAIGQAISDRYGVRCYPAMKHDSDEKYIVKIISVPASQTQLDALLLSGAYPDEISAAIYFKQVADNIAHEIDVLNQLAQSQAFLPYLSYQIVPMEDGIGYDIYLLSKYRCSLARYLQSGAITYLDAVNLALDLCASLSVCRRSGYLYASLKPANIYVSDEHEFYIGDLGFLKLDSLHFASLPDHCRSEYTPPEISDAFSKVNATIDIYAVGLILYQLYNGGFLPEASDSVIAPKYADPEMAQIILKAIHPSIAERWQDPTQLGQALVHYLQTHTIVDTPIAPDHLQDQTQTALIPDETGAEGRFDKDTATAIITSTEDPESDEVVYLEDDFGNLTFIEGVSGEDVLENQESFLFDYDEVSTEVSEMLTQADSLATLSVPEPPVAPEAPEIAVPELPQEVVDLSEDEYLPDEEQFEIPLEVEEIPIIILDEDEQPEPSDSESSEHVSNKKLLYRITAIVGSVILALALLFGGYYYYNHCYLQNIDAITTQGSADGLIVTVTTRAKESILRVICSDNYGNQITATVNDGIAVFHNLVPDTAYKIEIKANGFHKLTGATTASYKTPNQTNVVQFNAVTGAEDGSVILSFTLNGKDPGGWKVVYHALGEPIQSADFSSRILTLTDLSIGKEYTFTLVSETELYLTGTTQISFTASKLLYAQNLNVVQCMNDKLIAKWLAPEGASVASWTVRCYNANGYNETIITNESFATFENIICTDSYTVEVTANGMSVSERVYIPENTISAYDFDAQILDNKTLALSWKTSTDIPAKGWILQYSISGTDYVWSVKCSGNLVNLSPILPGCTYTFHLLTSDGIALLSDVLTFTVPQASDFSGTFGGLTVSRDDMQVQMCKTPSVKNWTYQNVKDTDYTTQFVSKQKASFLIKLNTSYGSDDTAIDILYVVRNSEGIVVSNNLKSSTWSKMWSKHYCGLDVPNMPTAAGEYNICVYFNGQIVIDQDFTINA